MPALDVTPVNIRPLDGAVVRPYILGGAAGLSDPVYLNGDATEALGEVELADASAAATADAIGVIVALDNKAATGVAGDRVSVCVWGPVAGYEDLTPGTRVYLSDDGDLADAAGTVTYGMGRADAEQVVFLMPGAGAPSS